MTENYIWIIVVAVILVMTIIGYIADKKDFGAKKDKKEKVSKKEEFITEQPVEEDFSNMENFDEPIDYSIQSNGDFQVEEPIMNDVEPVYEANDLVVENTESIVEPLYEEAFQPEPVAMEENFQEQVEQEEMPQVSMEEDAQVIEQPVVDSIEPVMPLDDFEMPNDDSVQEMTSEPVDELEKYKEDITEMPEINEEKIEPVEPENFELPNIEQLDQEIADVQEDEDVWKF